mmetsp:Transcript_31292/g.52757  ORF Transcript_31292/g.52757 Transcript_31292/m.52757 type:complete len:161 (+) Transcript_31292:854-1336(+)
MVSSSDFASVDIGSTAIVDGARETPATGAATGDGARATGDGARAMGDGAPATGVGALAIGSATGDGARAATVTGAGIGDGARASTIIGSDTGDGARVVVAIGSVTIIAGTVGEGAIDVVVDCDSEDVAVLSRVMRAFFEDGADSSESRVRFPVAVVEGRM